MEKVLNSDFDEIEEIEEQEELDEDEAYVRETEGTWEGDEFVGNDDEEELEDFKFKEE